MKKLVLIILISLFCIFGFAEDSYRLSVTSADDMSVSDNLVTLEGRVVLSFITSDGETDKTRELRADKVIIDIDKKNLDALGNVSLKEGDSSFNGDALSLDWDTLDVVVFGGTSSSDRTGSQGNTVKFFTVGNRIAYAGKNDAVYFKDGVISTSPGNSYWSITAKKIGLAGSDLFFSNATLKLGRVPVLWLPFIFYPGNRLSFNPAIGFSSTKGAFLNTTYEVFGTYPGIGGKASSAKVDSEDVASIASDFVSFLGSNKGEKEIRSGWSYVPLSKAENLSDLQNWALNTGSYLAIFADVWENYGISLGYTTEDILLDNSLTLSSTGLYNFKNSNESRYAFDLDLSYKIGKTKFSLQLPMLSDPDVKSDLLNRNTVFGVDTIFNAKQYFPSTYSSDIKKYSVVLNGNTSYSIGNFNFSLDSLKAQINYEWNAGEKKYEIKDATLPNMTFSSSGTLLNIQGERKEHEEDVKFNSSTTQKFYEEYQEIKDLIPENQSSDSTWSFIKGTEVQGKKNVVSDAAYLKVNYKYNQVLDNLYAEDFTHTSIYTKIDSTINVNGKSTGDWFSFTDTITPSFNMTKKEDQDKSVKEFKLVNGLNVSIPYVGLSYGLKSNVYNKEQWGTWDKKDILEHYVNINKKIKNLSLSLKYVLPPLDQLLVPSISYSNNGFSATSDISFSAKKDSFFEPTISHLNLSYSADRMNISFNNTYDFKKKENWEGYTAVQNFSYYLLSNNIKLSETLNLEKQFNVKSLVFSANYNKNSISFSFKDKEVKADKLAIVLNQSVEPVYIWNNRIGFEGSIDLGFTYDFQNEYNSSLYLNMNANFSISKFLDLAISVKSINNSFYNYYEKLNGKNKFRFNLFWKDLMRSFDFVGNGRYQTSFNVNTYSISAIHYMEDWTLNLTASSSVKNVNGKNKFVPEITFLIKWNAIPELKSTNSWKESTGWDKK